jgi:hypothetical protein
MFPNLARCVEDGRVVSLLALPILFIGATCNAPAVTTFHEDLPAYAPSWGPPESRFGYHRVFWTDGTIFRPADYFDLGCRTGQQAGAVAFEQGLTAVVFTNSLVAGPQVGVTLVHPSIALRGSWLPVRVAGQVRPDGLRFGFEPDKLWQVTMLGGTPYRAHGLGWAAGGRVSRQGFGPVLTGEFGSGVLSLRTELSATFRTPWADSTTKGQSITLGIGAAHHGRAPAEP